MEGDNPAFPCDKFGLEKGGEAVGTVDLGTGFFGCGDVAGVGAIESVERTENRVVSRIFPRDSWEELRFLEIR